MWLRNHVKNSFDFNFFSSVNVSEKHDEMIISIRAEDGVVHGGMSPMPLRAVFAYLPFRTRCKTKRSSWDIRAFKRTKSM